MARDHQHRLEVPAADPPPIDELPGLVHTVSDREGRVRYISPGIERILGYSPEYILEELAQGRDPLLPIDRDLVTRVWAQSGATGAPFTCEYRVRDSEGRLVWLRSHGRWRTGDDGERLLDSVILDVTDVKEAQARLEFRVQLNDLLRPLEDAAEIIAVATEALGKHLSVNRCSFAELGADGRSAWIERDYVEGVASLAGRSYRLADFGGLAVREIGGGRTIAIEDIAAHEKGAPAEAFAGVEVRALLAAPLVKQGRLVAILALQDNRPRRWRRSEIAVAEEIALQTWLAVERARAEAALRRSEEQLQLAVDAGEIAFSDWDVATNRVTLGGHAPRILGLEPGGFAGTVAAFVALIHPDDLAIVTRAGQEARRSGDGEPIEFRMVRPDGGIRWIAARSRTFRDAEGRVQRVIGVGQDITHRKELQLEAERAREQAETANRAKDEILRVVSHELRTPITPLVGWIRELREDFEDAETTGGGAGAIETRHVLGIIERNALTLSRLVSDLVDASRIETGKLHVELAPIDLGPVVSAALRSLQPVAQANGVALEAEIAPDVGTVQGDAGRLEQVASNLIANAIKFTPRGGTVSVRLCGDERAVELRVADTGAGISPSFLSRVFDRFAQEERPDLTVRGGLGLGLAIVRHVVALHGGTIAAASEGPGKGSTFTVQLPRVGEKLPG